MKRLLLFVLSATLWPTVVVADTQLWAKRGEPWVEIHGRERDEADVNNIPVFINRIDHRSFNGTFEVRNLAAGEHEVVFQTTRFDSRIKIKSFTQTLTIDTQPCMRYWVSATHESNLSPRYEVKVYKEELIRPCAKKHGIEYQASDPATDP